MDLCFHKSSIKENDKNRNDNQFDDNPKLGRQQSLQKCQRNPRFNSKNSKTYN